jgi:hypothetical protein
MPEPPEGVPQEPGQTDDGKVENELIADTAEQVQEGDQPETEEPVQPDSMASESDVQEPVKMDTAAPLSAGEQENESAHSSEEESDSEEESVESKE